LIPLAAFKNERDRETISSTSSMRGHTGFEGMEKYTHENFEGKTLPLIILFFNSYHK
jgi:hypothetical protein